MTTAAIASKRRTIDCAVHYRKIASEINPAALSHLFAEMDSPAILGSNAAAVWSGRFNYWTAKPRETVEFCSGQGNPFEKLQKAFSKYRLCNGSDKDLPAGMFCGGWIGYFGYELGRYIETLPQKAVEDIPIPLFRLCFYDRTVCYDHSAKCVYLIALELADDTETATEKLDSLEELVQKTAGIKQQSSAAAVIESPDFSLMRCNISKDYYLQAFDKIKRHIYDGDVYQVNFSARFECDYTAKPIDLFAWQNDYNASGYAAYIDGGDFQIVSASPEMFLTITDGTISTKPIKGTRPRLSEAVSGKLLNERSYNELLTSEKEQAELNMIIDLERNDLARICKAGTRRVVQGRTIEAYPTVFHAAATIAGELRDDVTMCDILRATFPGGSITGAPKVSAMRIIDELEPTTRSVYTGSIGFIGINGSACLNVAIRTIIITGGKAYAQAGGGIVADSQPEDEWQEVLAKAKALVAGIKGVVRNAYRTTQYAIPDYG